MAPIRMERTNGFMATMVQAHSPQRKIEARDGGFLQPKGNSV